MERARGRMTKIESEKASEQQRKRETPRMRTENSYGEEAWGYTVSFSSISSPSVFYFLSVGCSLTNTHTHTRYKYEYELFLMLSPDYRHALASAWLHQLDKTHKHTHVHTHKQHRACPPGFGVFSNNRAFEKYLKAFTISSLIFPTVYIYHICRMFLNAACNQVELVDSLCSPVFSVFNLSVCVNVWWKHFLSFRQRKK